MIIQQFGKYAQAIDHLQKTDKNVLIVPVTLPILITQ